MDASSPSKGVLGKMRRDAAPPSPAELIEWRRFFRHAKALEEQLDTATVATRLGFCKRTVLELVKAGEFRGAWKPSYNQIRIPLSAVNEFLEKRRVVPEEEA